MIRPWYGQTKNTKIVDFPGLVGSWAERTRGEREREREREGKKQREREREFEVCEGMDREEENLTREDAR